MSLEAENPTPVKRKYSTNKTLAVKRLKREGVSDDVIATTLNISKSSVHYHLSKKRTYARGNESKKEESNQTQMLFSRESDSGFEAEVFGTLIRLDKAPKSIERIGNRIVIK